MKNYYFGYGSNLSESYMKSRCGNTGVEKIGKGVLEDNKIMFHYWADVEKSKGHKVEGIVYELTPEKLALLDITEQVPQTYIRTLEEIKMESGRKIKAWVYRMTNGGIMDWETRGNYSNYMQEIVKNAKELGFSKDYVDYLVSITL